FLLLFGWFSLPPPTSPLFPYTTLFRSFWIGNKQFLFHSTYRLNAEFQNVAGLNGGAEVRVGGIHEGTVRQIQLPVRPNEKVRVLDRKSTRLNSSHQIISYAVFCLKKKN